MIASAAPSDRRVEASDVAIVVPVGGAAPAWERCAKSLARLEPPPGEIIVVIDGPHDHLATAATGIGARTVRLAERGGPARARNRGAQATDRAILLFVDADVEVPPDLIARVAELFADPQAPAAVIGSYDDSPGDPRFPSQYRNLLHHFVHQTGREQASTFWAGCGAVRHQAFDEVSGFDESYTEPSIEDIELGSRLLRAGHTIRLVKELQVKHLKRWRAGDMLATDLLRRAVPWTRLMLAEKHLINDLNVKTRDRVSVLMAFIALAALPAAWRWPVLLALCGGALVLVIAINAGLFGLFLRRRGPLFAAAAVPLYWIYLLICGLGFGLGLMGHLLDRKS